MEGAPFNSVKTVPACKDSIEGVANYEVGQCFPWKPAGSSIQCRSCSNKCLALHNSIADDSIDDSIEGEMAIDL